MNILIINGSPKRKGGTSRFLSKLLRMMLIGCRVTSFDIRGPGDYEKGLALLPQADAVLISAPLYVDGIPAHILPFLIRAEHHCRAKVCRFKLYALSNSGFIEARQNTLHLKMYQAWCCRAGNGWGGGLGIGGGTMLHVLYLIFPIMVSIRLVQLVGILINTGSITAAELWAHTSGLLVTPFLFSLPLICTVILATAIRSGKCIRNIYARPLIPSFLFLIAGDLFMLLSAALQKTLPHRLFRKSQ